MSDIWSCVLRPYHHDDQFLSVFFSASRGLPPNSASDNLDPLLTEDLPGDSLATQS